MRNGGDVGGRRRWRLVWAEQSGGQEYVHPAPKKSEIAAGVYYSRRSRTATLGWTGIRLRDVERRVLVFDANGTPAAARAVIAEIRKITDKPVKYLVISHWPLGSLGLERRLTKRRFRRADYFAGNASGGSCWDRRRSSTNIF